MTPVLVAGLILAAWLALAAITGSAVGTLMRTLRNDQYWDDRAQAELAEEET